MIKLRKKRIRGFTLAEVLVTLAVIGIVAALTVPALIKTVQFAQFKPALKKKYSEVNSAFMQLVQDNGGSIKGVYNDQDEFILALGNKMKYVKYCPLGSGDDCLPESYLYYNGRTDDGGRGCGVNLVANDDRALCAVLVLNDGSFIIENASWFKDCNYNNPLVSIDTCNLYNRFGIDINGAKGPNKLGYDYFAIQIYKDRLIPAGAEVDGYTGTNYCSYKLTCEDGESGYGCTAKYLLNK